MCEGRVVCVTEVMVDAHGWFVVVTMGLACDASGRETKYVSSMKELSQVASTRFLLSPLSSLLSLLSLLLSLCPCPVPV